MWVLLGQCGETIETASQQPSTAFQPTMKRNIGGRQQLTTGQPAGLALAIGQAGKGQKGGESVTKLL